MSSWAWSPDAVGAVATACGTLVALGFAVIPALRMRCRTEALARAMFGHDVLQVIVATHEMCSPAYIRRLHAGELPSERQKRALSLDLLKGQMSSLNFSNVLTDDVFQLIRQCDELLWFIENLSNPDIDYQNGKSTDVERNRVANRALVTSQARTVNGLAKKIQAQLYQPTRWKRLKQTVRKRSFFNAS